jgi:hypothetical protein
MEKAGANNEYVTRNVTFGSDVFYAVLFEVT